MTGASPLLTTEDKGETEGQKEEDIDKSDKSLQWRKTADYTSLSNKRRSRHMTAVCFGILNYTLYELSTESSEIRILLTVLSNKPSLDKRKLPCVNGWLRIQQTKTKLSYFLTVQYTGMLWMSGH